MASNSTVTPPTAIQVATVLNAYRLVINRGRANGIINGNRFQIYTIGEEVIDPSTGKSLGKVEVVRGTGVVIHTQESIATIQTDMEQPGGRKITEVEPFGSYGTIYGGVSGYSGFSGVPTFPRREIEEAPPQLVPFDNPKVGDFARRI